MKRVVHAACPHDCPDACGVLITIQDGRAIKIQGDPEHPVTRGFLCAKVAKYLDRVYSPDRVLYPMRRVKAKGPGSLAQGRARTMERRASSPAPAAAPPDSAFERISWDQALDEITHRFSRVIAKHGTESILPYSYGGTLGALNGASMDRRFFHSLGASQLARTICSSAGEEGLKSVIGIKLGTEPEQFAQSRYIIAWGSNIHGNNVHLWPFIEEARRKGAKLVVIDPYRTRTAKYADWYLPIHPGTDAALALGLIHVIINENLFDADYVSRFTLGFEELKARAQQYPPEIVAHWTGISAADIRKLAREYATERPSVIRVNYGIQRSERGGMSMRAVTLLPCLIGSWKEIGGGLQLSLSGSFGLDLEALEMPHLMEKALGRPARVINMVQLGSVLNSTTMVPPVRALFVYNSNPAAVCPDHNQVVRGLMRPDLFTVVHEQFFTDTTDYADIVLPATTFFEHKDLQSAYGHYYLQVSNQAMEPLGECRSNVEMFRALAERMGLEDECFHETVDSMIDRALQSPNPWLQGITRQRLEREHQIRLNFSAKNDGATGVSPVQAERNSAENTAPFLPFANGNFPTPSGKAEFYSTALERLGLDPVIAFTPPKESRHGSRAAGFPLELLARKPDNHLNSSFANIPSVRQMEPWIGDLEMHSSDAEARGVRDGDRVRAFNHRGEIVLNARVDGSVPPGIVAARLDWARFHPGGGNINVLTSEKLTDLGNAATFYSVCVEVELFRA
ncbi:MAG: molybdopterin-dependent oxidoreductase [Terriglobales bacterium]